MNQFEVRPIDKYELDTWDAFIAENPAGTIFHTSLWQRAINQSYGDGQYTLLGVFNQQELLGGFCALTRKRLGASTAVTPLCTPYSGFIPCAGDNAALTALASHLRRYKYQHIQCAPGSVDVQTLINAGYQLTPRRTLAINLRLPETELWDSFAGTVRRNIRKAGKLDYEITDQWDKSLAWQTFQQTFTRRGQACPVPEPFFHEISSGSILSDSRRRYCAWKDGRLHAFIIALRHNGKVYYELAAANPDALKSGVSSLLIWELLRDHLDGQWDIFDFVGANTETITRFKQGFAATPVKYYAAERCTSRRIALGRAARRLLFRRRR